MELDELRTKWAEYDRKLDVSIRLNRQLLRETYTRRARFALWRLAAMLAAGALFMLAIIVSLGRFIALNWGTPKLTVPAIVLDIAAIASLVALNAQIGLALNIDYSQPIAVIQRRLETLRSFRIRYVQVILLTSALLWMPIFIVLTMGIFPMSWILANVAFGLVVLAVGVWLVRRFGSRFLPDLAGYNLKAAAGFLATLAQFEKD
jgi:hypothetical protein